MAVVSAPGMPSLYSGVAMDLAGAGADEAVRQRALALDGKTVGREICSRYSKRNPKLERSHPEEASVNEEPKDLSASLRWFQNDSVVPSCLAVYCALSPARVALNSAISAALAGFPAMFVS